MHISTTDTQDPCDVGQQTTFVIAIRNEGTSPCTYVQLKNIVSEQMAFVSASIEPLDVRGRTIVFPKVEKLEPAEKITYKITCKAIRSGSSKNKAVLTYNEFDNPIIDEEGTSVYK